MIKEDGKQAEPNLVYSDKGIIAQEWRGSDDDGHWQTIVSDGKGNDIIQEVYKKFNQGREEGDYKDVQVKVTIEVIEPK